MRGRRARKAMKVLCLEADREDRKRSVRRRKKKRRTEEVVRKAQVTKVG